MNDDYDQIRDKVRGTKTSHFFLRNAEGHRIGVVALRLEGYSGELQVRIAVSLCHGNDAWNSTTGVAAARGRLDARNVKRFDNMCFSVAGHHSKALLLHDVFQLLKPAGLCKRESQVDWFKTQVLFERQWKYLTTPKAEKTESEKENHADQ